MSFLNFDHGESLAMLRETLQDFAEGKSRRAPPGSTHERISARPVAKLGKLGFSHTSRKTTRQHDGLPRPVIAMEEISRVPRRSASYGAHSNCA